MYTMTYNSLIEDIRNYLERGFSLETDAQVFNQIPRFITLAQRRIARDLKVEGLIRVVTTSMLAGVSVYPKPDRWRKTISIRYSGRVLNIRSYEYLRNYWPNPADTGSPEFYADYDYANWLIAPTPATPGVFEILYYEQPALLGDDQSTNWLTEFAPDLLQYAALMEAMLFLKNDERVALFAGQYQQAAGSLSSEDMKRITDRTSARTEA